MKIRNDGCRRLFLLVAMAGGMWLSASAHGVAQPAGCTLVADDRNPTEKILRCGDTLTIRNAPQSRYRPTGQHEQQAPTGVRLESGAVMIEFTPSERQKNFQIQTPHAIAAVRGTQWAVQVERGQTSTLVLSGTVEVTSPRVRRAAMLHAGEGADVTAGTRDIMVKRWPQKRVDALLARFGQ
jgi:ferric-dicitrate binding protein FerR (iron transport regulator)